MAEIPLTQLLLPVTAVLVILVGAWTYYKKAQDAKPRRVLRPDEYQEFPLVDKTVLSHNTAIYRFALPRKVDIVGLPIGQHMSVAATLPVQPTPKEIVRSYTPISSDEDSGYFDLLIKAYPQGNISKHVASLEIGDNIKVKGPKGAMVYTPNMVKHIGMIAGGTGLTPMLQIIRAVIRGRPKNGGSDTTKMDLIFANVNHEDILLKETLDKLSSEDEAFNVHYVLNNPPEKWSGYTGFCTPEIIKAKLPAPANDIKILMCGPPPMISAMKKATESLGYDKPRPVSKLPDQVFCF